jgi:hypothetical protein
MTAAVTPAAPHASRNKRIAGIAALCLIIALGWTRPGWRRSDLSVKIAAINALTGECSDQIPLGTTGYAAGAVTRDGRNASYSTALRGPHDSRGRFTAALQPAGNGWRVAAANITLADQSLDLRDCPPPPIQPAGDDTGGEEESAAASDGSGV